MISKGQSDLLKSKTNVKDFVYTIMSMLWTREVLATHSITGRASNAFKDRDPKPKLDQDKIGSICGMFFGLFLAVSGTYLEHLHIDP